MVKIPTGQNGQFVVVSPSDIESVSRETTKTCRIRTKSGVTHHVVKPAEEILKAFNISVTELKDQNEKKAK